MSAASARTLDLPPSDALIRQHVREALDASEDLDATQLEVIVSNREVTLTGYVCDLYEKRFAEDIAATCRGSRRVVNMIELFPPSRAPRTMRSGDLRGGPSR